MFIDSQLSLASIQYWFAFGISNLGVT